MQRKRIAVTVLAVLAVAAAYLLIPAERAWAEPVLHWGSKGHQVQRVQQRLASWGYYHGPVDGAYGFRTWRAVRSFQARNGLPVTGTVDEDTWCALGLADPVTRDVPAVSDDGLGWDIWLLARVIQGEAGSEPFVGKVAVGAVIMNRVRSASFPNTIAGVVFQGAAFESVLNGLIWRVPVTADSLRAARLALAGWDPTGGATFFWNPYKRVSPWIWTRRIITQIGRHVFGR